MFNNIGGKIKGLATATFIVEAISAIVTGIALMCIDEDLIGIGLLVMLVGPIVSWISSWLLYGFGQLIENSDIIAEEYKRKNKKHEKVVAKNNSEKETQRREKVKAIIASSDTADDEFVDISCPNCKEELSYTKEQLQNGGTICPMCNAQIFL